MGLLEDIGGQQQAASPQAAQPQAQSGGLLSDLGYQASQQQAPQQQAGMGIVDKNMAMLKGAPRALLEGVGGFADTATGLMSKALSEGRDEEPDHPVFKAIAKEVADRLNLPKMPNTTAGRIIGSGIEAAPGGAVLGPGAIVPSIISGAASQGAAEAGAGPVGQFAAGVAAPMGPSMAGNLAKGVLRGGEANAANMREKLATFDQAGITPTGEQVGAARGGGTPTKQTLAAQPGQAQQQVEKIASQAAGRTKPATNVEAGEEIDNGIKAARMRMAQQESQAYENARTMIGGNTPMDADNFIRTAKDVTEPTSKDAINEWLIKNRAQGLREAVESSTAPKQGSILLPGAGPKGGTQAAQYPAEKFTFDDLRALRADLGSSIDWGLNPSNPGPNAVMKRLYNALGQDLEAGVGKAPPAAQTAYKQANALYKSNAQQRELLDTVVGKVGGSEAIYKAATNNMVDGPTKIKTVMNAMTPEEQGVLRSSITARLGRPRGSENRNWDENTYRTNWGNLSDDTRTVLYGPKGSQVRDQLEAIGSVMNIREALGQNTSKLAQSVEQGTSKSTHGMKIAGILGGGALAAKEFGPMIEHIAQGHPFLATGAALGTAAGLGARAAWNRVLNNPDALNWMAQASKSPKTLLPSMMTQLTRMGQTGQDISEVLQ